MTIGTGHQGTRVPTDHVSRAQAGDRAAFDALYDEHVGHVYAVCLRMTADPRRAERLTQDAFVRAWQGLPRFRGDSRFSSWLHRLTVNVVLEDARRERRREKRVTVVADLAAHESGVVAGDADGRIDLERAIAALPAGARRALVLHHVLGHPQKEVAEMLGVAVGTVKAQVHRARRLLREMLSE
ncbi:MAG TPA: RNA polymerase sigma factor [Longimicrobiales bacterium]|nr:RNA polymerase sigma factor [Longimicrobiales bacterium]